MDTSKEITFGKNPIFGALAVALPDIAIDFRGDLLSLTVLDGLASQFQVPFSLSTVWRKLLNASRTARFVIACGNGHGIDMTKMSLAGALESKARASLRRQRDREARSRLLAVLQDMDAQLDADEESGETLDIRDGVSRLFGTKADRAKDKRILRGAERDVCKTIVRLAVEIAAKGPAAHFRIDLCRKGMTKLMMGDLLAKEPESFRRIRERVRWLLVQQAFVELTMKIGMLAAMIMTTAKAPGPRETLRPAVLKIVVIADIVHIRPSLCS